MTKTIQRERNTVWSSQFDGRRLQVFHLWTKGERVRIQRINQNKGVINGPESALNIQIVLVGPCGRMNPSESSDCVKWDDVVTSLDAPTGRDACSEEHAFLHVWRILPSIHAPLLCHRFSRGRAEPWFSYYPGLENILCPSRIATYFLSTFRI